MATSTPAYLAPLPSITVDDGAMAHHDPIGAPLSPPLSQESHVSLTEPEVTPSSDPSLPQHQHSPNQLRPALSFDQTISASNATLSSKKTLNWVNALPSHFDTSSAGHPRKRRRRTNREELEILEDAFAKNFLPDAATRQELGERLGMNVRAVQIWFQNRRQTLRKKSISLGTQQPGQGSEDDRCRSDEEFGHPLEEQCPSNLVTPVLSTDGRGGERERGLKRGSKSCSNLLSSTPQTVTDPNSTTLLRAETCSSLLTTVSVLPQQPRVTSTASSSPESGMANGTANEQTSGTGEVVVKTEVVESDPLRVSAAPATIPDIDTKTADRHLCMLLEEAKKRSGQCVAPVMGLWSEPSTKTVLNGSSSGNLSGTTTFPSSKRTMSTPTMRPSSSSQHSRSKARRHRSMPDPMTLQPSPVRLPYPRTVSLMERVINRQQHLRPASSNFKQSALSSTGKYSLDTISRRGTESSTTSTGLTPSQLARRLQYVMSANLKRVQSESVLHERRNTRRLGQTAMKARQLSFGTSLFESDPEDENRSTPPRLPSKGHEFEQLSHQAQKRRAGTSEPDHSSRTTDGDETDEEDFVALNERALKRLNLTKSIVSKSAADSRPQERGPQQQPPQPIKHRQDWSRLKLHQKSLKSSLSAFSLVTSSPTREYGLELDRSSSSLPNCPIIEKNRTWNSGSTMDQQSTITGTSSGHPKVSDPRSTDEKNLNMDELECASVLAGLGWGR